MHGMTVFGLLFLLLCQASEAGGRQPQAGPDGVVASVS